MAEDYRVCDVCKEVVHCGMLSECNGCDRYICNDCSVDEEWTYIVGALWGGKRIISPYCDGKCIYLPNHHSDIEIAKHEAKQQAFIKKHGEESYDKHDFPCMCRETVKTAREDYLGDLSTRKLCEECTHTDKHRVTRDLQLLLAVLEETGTTYKEAARAMRNKHPLTLKRARSYDCLPVGRRHQSSL